MVYDFEIYRPSYYSPRLYSYYYPVCSMQDMMEFIDELLWKLFNFNFFCVLSWWLRKVYLPKRKIFIKIFRCLVETIVCVVTYLIYGKLVFVGDENKNFPLQFFSSTFLNIVFQITLTATISLDGNNVVDFRRNKYLRW